MRVSIQDRKALRAVSPGALSAYARTAGWSLDEPYRARSDVYIGEGLPEIIVPRTEHLGDYASVVAALIETFAEVAERDELTVYRSLLTADRDVVRVRAGESEDGSVALSDGADLIDGTRKLLLAAACSLDNPRAVYRTGANRQAAKLLEDIRLGQTDHGSFVVTLLTPAVPPAISSLYPETEDLSAPIQRRLTRRLMEALTSARLAVERTMAGHEGAFVVALKSGVSANLCEALAQMIDPFPTLDIDVLWARTRPIRLPPRIIRFGPSEAHLLREAARSFRKREPRPDFLLYGYVRLLTRGSTDDHGTIHLATSIDKQRLSVRAVLEREDYERAVQAHKDGAVVIMTGDLERVGQRWRLLNPLLCEVIRDDEPILED